MGNADTKLNFRKAVVQLTSKTQPIDPSDDGFWSQFWSESITSIQDVFALIPSAEIRALREECPSNLATLCYKCVERLVHAADSACATQQEHSTVINCVRILSRLLPYIFEDPDWRSFFWSSLPGSSKQTSRDGTNSPDNATEESVPLAQSLLNALCDLLFCPDFTVYANKKTGPDKHEDLHSIDSCEYIWEAGVGFAHSAPHDPRLDNNRTEILKLLLTCFSQAMYHPPGNESEAPNRWVQHFASPENRHALPLFTSLLNVVCAYDPVGLGLPYNHLLFTDSREPLVEAALQLLIVTLDWDSCAQPASSEESAMVHENLFINYLSRIHREEDFAFMLHGFTRLLKNPLIQTYLPNSNKKVQNHQELLVFFWKVCDFNKKFLYYVLKSSDVLDVLVPILFHLNDSRADQSRVGLMHIGVFILLLLSGERNFGVRLNKPYTATVPMDIPVFTGTHADLLIVVFHKIITTGHQRLQPLFDCLLTILVNVSPYLKTLSMVASTKLLHLLEAFSTPWFLFSAPNNHHLVFFLLEIFNNIIQYQFDGNANLVYTIIRKRHVFHALASLPTDCGTINRSLSRRGRKQLGRQPSMESTKEAPSMEGSHPAQPAQPGTHTCSLAVMPAIEKITEQETAHPSLQQLSQLTGSAASAAAANGAMDNITISHEIEERGPIPELNESEFDSDAEKPKMDEGTFSAAVSEAMGVPLPETAPLSPALSQRSSGSESSLQPSASNPRQRSTAQGGLQWVPNPDWVASWKQKLPLQTIMRLLQVLVPQVEKICIDKGLTDESEILKFLQHGTLVGLLPVPHPILIRKYQANSGTSMWFRTYMWGIIYLRNVDPPIWYDTAVKLFEIQRI